MRRDEVRGQSGLALLHVVLPLPPLLGEVVEDPVQPPLHAPHVVTADLVHGPGSVQPAKAQAADQVLQPPHLGPVQSVAGENLQGDTRLSTLTPVT